MHMVRWMLLLMGLGCAVQAGAAVSAAAPATAPDDLFAVRQADTRFWDAYNRCDLAAMGALLTADVEFWHDKTGLTTTRAAVVHSLAAGPCGTPGMHLRREAVAESVQAYPLADAGALITGEHHFLVTLPSQRERLDGSARFSSVWTRGPDRQWRMHRIISFDHQSVAYRATDDAVVLGATQLQRLTGRYATRTAGVAQISMEGAQLWLIAGDFRLPLFAASPRRFFARDRDLQVIFNGTGDALPSQLEIVEAGTVSERAPRLP